MSAATCFGFDESDGESAQTGDIFWSVVSVYSATIFIVVPIDDIVAAILDAPVAAVGGKNTLGIGLVWGSAGDAVGEFTGLFAGLFFDSSAEFVGDIRFG